MKDTKHIRREFYFVTWGMPQRRDFGALGYPGGQTFFFKHGHVAYQINGDDEQNKCQKHLHPRVKLVTLGRGHKVKFH